MVVVSLRTDFFGSTTTPLLAIGLLVGSGFGDDSGDETLGPSVGADRPESPPVEASTLPSLATGRVVASKSSGDSVETMVLGRIDGVGAEVMTGKVVMTSSEADDDEDELEDDEDDATDRSEVEVAESLVVSYVVSPAAVLAPPVTPAVVLPFATVASVITGPTDELASETCDVTPLNVSEPPATSWPGVNVVTFGSPTTAVEAVDSTTGVVVWTIGEVVSIMGTLVGEAVLSTASVDSMLELMLDARLLVAGLDTAEMGIWFGTCRVGAATSVWPASKVRSDVVVWLPAEVTVLAAFGVLVSTRTELAEFTLLGLATMLVVTSAVEMTGTGSTVVTSLTGLEEAWLRIIEVSSVVTLVFVPVDVVGAEASEAIIETVVGTSVVMAGEVCCGTLVLLDDTSPTSELKVDNWSLVDVESMTLDTSGTSVGDAWASVVAAVDSPVVTLGEGTLEDSGSSDCCDSIPVSIAVVIEGTSEDSSDALEANSDGCAEMTKDDCWIDVGSPVNSLGELSAVAVSMNRKLVVGAGPSE
jgi:hypothetical protein